MKDLNVLLPLDGSKAAESALEYVRALKPVIGSVRLLSIIDAPGPIQIEETRREELSAAYLHGIAADLLQDLECPVEWRIESGHSTEEITRAAGDTGIDLIVMASHGWTNASSESLGSVADKVVRGSACPVLLVSPRRAVPERIWQITCLVDGSELALGALPLTRRMAEGLHAQVQLLRVMPPPLDAVNESTDTVVEEIQDHLESCALGDLETAEDLLGTSIPVHCELLRGNVVEALQEELTASPPDLLVMTSHGAGGFMPWALGSVTERLMRVELPVLIIRPLHGHN